MPRLRPYPHRQRPTEGSLLQEPDRGSGNKAQGCKVAQELGIVVFDSNDPGAISRSQLVE